MADDPNGKNSIEPTPEQHDRARRVLEQARAATRPQPGHDEIAGRQTRVIVPSGRRGE